MIDRIGEALRQAMGWTDKQLEIYQNMGVIVVAMNSIYIEDLKQMTQEISRDEAIGPLIDPTAWRDGKFEEVSMVKITIKAVIDFKRAVSGIGRFHDVKKET